MAEPKKPFYRDKKWKLVEVSAGGIYRTARNASGSWGCWSKSRKLKNARCAANR